MLLGNFATWLVSVVFRLERPVNANAEILGLVLSKFGKFDSKSVQVQPGDLLVQLQKHTQHTSHHYRVCKDIITLFSSLPTPQGLAGLKNMIFLGHYVFP